MNADLLRRIARLWSLASLAFMALMIGGELLAPTSGPPSGDEWLGLALFPAGVMAGLILAWRREGLGGAIAVASFLGFYLWNYAGGGSLPRGPWFLLVAAPGFLFLASWWMVRRAA